MFGMLDYRAYKLYWLICLPLRIAARLAFFVIIGIAIFIGHRTGYHVLVQMVIAYVAFEAISWVFIQLWALLIVMPIAKAFFWVIDVIPSRGENMEEAKLIVNVGPFVWLDKKFMNDIGNLTIDDTEEYAKCMSWRARLWFNAEERIGKRARIMQEVYRNTGKQLAELGEDEAYKLLKPYQHNWLERFIIHPYGWNSITAGIIIIVGILYLRG